MIYSRFGTKLTLISKEEDASGRLLINATAEDTDGTRQYTLSDLKADDGMPEINDAVAKLPLRDTTKQVDRGSQKLR